MSVHLFVILYALDTHNLAARQTVIKTVVAALVCPPRSRCRGEQGRRVVASPVPVVASRPLLTCPKVEAEAAAVNRDK